MKIFKIVLSLIVIAFMGSCNKSDDNHIIPEPEPDPFPPSYVELSQYFSYKNSNNENLFATGVYKDEYLSLICTDENGEDLYINGQLVADIENIVEIGDIVRDEEGVINSVELKFYRPFSYNEANNSSISYYKLKYDEDKYDIITVNCYFNLQNNTQHYITTVVYNGIEYDYSPPEAPIIIVKEE